MTVAELLERGLLESIAADPKAARRLLADAKRHLASAGTLARADRNGSYQLAYDAARKAVAAHMAAAGLRARPYEAGAHAIVVMYGVAVLDEPAIRHFDRMRRLRNAVQYGGSSVGVRQLEADLETATAIVAAVEAALPALG